MKGLKIYLGIDGVLISKRNRNSVLNAFEFISLITTHFDTYWLTTHCKGNPEHALYYLANFYDREFIELASRIKPTNWEKLRTEAIQFTSDFYWIDDEPYNSEKIFLESKNRLDRLIIPDYSKNADLLPIISYLSKYIHL